jgi:hypothetical protein
MVSGLPAHKQKKEEHGMEALAIAAVAHESRLLRERPGIACLDDTDQDLMFPVCGSAESYYSAELRAIVDPVQTSPCPQQAANFVSLYGHTGWILPLFERGEL